MIQQRPGVQCNELAALFDRSTRTIQRDLEQLRKLGFTIRSSRGPAGGFAARGGYHLKPLTFTGPEALALFIAARVLLEEEEEGFPYRSALQAALEKIAGVVNEKDEDFLSGLEPNISLLVTKLRNYAPWGKTFRIINEAILNHDRLTMVYSSYASQCIARRTVDPYHVLFREGFWYLIGYCHTRRETRIFRIDRIKDISPDGEKFDPPGNFSVREYLGKSWRIGKGEDVEVAVKFYPPESRLIAEGAWHPTQRLEQLPGGEVIFRAEVEGTWEVKKWILGWGSSAEVLSPPELRDEIRRELAEMAGRYG
ncbi:MAG: transcriptional regulator [Peptococcaceae bacterium]|nr:transcriptional regulator [Peptococcaceae bacterium]